MNNLVEVHKWEILLGSLATAIVVLLGLYLMGYAVYRYIQVSGQRKRGKEQRLLAIERNLEALDDGYRKVWSKLEDIKFELMETPDD